MLRIIADENMPELAAFAPLGDVTPLPGRSISRQDLAHADVLLVRSVTRVDETLLADTPVTFVGSATIGTDHVDMDYLRQRGIGFAHAPGCNAQAVVEYVLQAILNWCVEQQCEPSQLSLGIVGVGNVGSRLATHAAALGIAVKVSDPPRQERGDTLGWHTAPLEELLACDVVSLHVPLTHQGAHATYHLLSESQLQQMTASQLLINSCRGPVVDNQALLQRLQQNGPVCVLDVWEAEPRVPADLYAAIWRGTPHIAGYSLEGKQRGSRALLVALADWLGQSIQVPALTHAGTITMDIDSWRDVHEWLRQAYHLEADHHRLGASLGASDLAQAFDQLRKDYPLRRELSAWELRGKVGAEVAAIAALLQGKTQ